MLDSSVIDSLDVSLDGQRHVDACCPEHLKALIDQARAGWIVEELWFGQLCRASIQHRMRDVDVTQLGARARLSPKNLRHALLWNAGRDRPVQILPGGQVLPLLPMADLGQVD